MKPIPKIALLAGIYSLVTLGNFTTVFAQDKKSPSKGSKTAAKEEGGYTMLPSSLEYKIVRHGTGKRKPVLNDHIEIHIHVHVNDSTIFDSRKMNNDKPVSLPLTAPRYKGDPLEGFVYMVEGDSAVLRVSADTMKKIGAPLPPYVKEGDKMEYDVVLVSVRSDAEDKKHNEEMAAKQNAIDDVILREYFEGKKVKPMKTQSGLYYTITTPGSGEKIVAGRKASVNYTGMFLSGKAFDSNVDSAFHHVQPFELEVGKGRVIKGWDEGIQLLKKGSKATFYIPSSLAYGSMEQRGIPANSILIFDVEITDVTVPVDYATADDNTFKEYFKTHNIKAEKTPSGLYYTINRPGLGNTAKPGKKITMNYTGKLLDGTTFDSNTDPQFGHVAPFQFTLGSHMVIAGWDEGVQLLKMGCKATFYIPSGLAYGPAGAAGGKIPPNAPLIFDVELVGIDK